MKHLTRKNKWLGAVFFFLFFLGGCTSVFRTLDYESQADHYLGSARKLEKSGKFHEAAQQYILVATEYPSSWQYKAAVRKAGLLLCRPDNPLADIAGALHWLQIYEKLSVSPEEKENARLLIALLGKWRDMQSKTVRLESENNELSAKIAKLFADNTKLSDNNKKLSEKMVADNEKLAADNEKIQILESKLEQAHQSLLETTKALEKMKEVDARLHQSKQDQ